MQEYLEDEPSRSRTSMDEQCLQRRNLAHLGHHVHFRLLPEQRKAIDSNVYQKWNSEDLTQVPRRIDELCASKFYLTATRLLLDTLNMLDTPDLRNIQALRDIKRYCLSKKEVWTFFPLLERVAR